MTILYKQNKSKLKIHSEQLRLWNKSAFHIRCTVNKQKHFKTILIFWIYVKTIAAVFDCRFQSSVSFSVGMWRSDLVSLYSIASRSQFAGWPSFVVIFKTDTLFTTYQRANMMSDWSWGSFCCSACCPCGSGVSLSVVLKQTQGTWSDTHI